MVEAPVGPYLAISPVSLAVRCSDVEGDLRDP